MRLFGYTDEKNVVLCRLSPLEICRLGIHPYHLDLREEQPVSFDIEGIRLNFSPLRDFAFAVADADGTHLGIVSRNKRRVLRGTAMSLAPFSISDVVQSSLPFEQLFLKCLGDKEEPDRPYTIVGPIEPERLVMRGRTISLDEGSASHQQGPMLTYNRLFKGTMFESVELDVHTGPQIDWLLNRLSRWSCAIRWRALQHVIAGKPVTDVVGLVERGSLYAIIRDLECEGIVVEAHASGDVIDAFEFHFGGCHYTIAARTFLPEDPNVLSKMTGYETSVDAMLSRRPRRIRASWLALFDFRRGQQRDLTLWPASQMTLEELLAERERNLQRCDDEFLPISWRTVEEELRSSRGC